MNNHNPYTNILVNAHFGPASPEVPDWLFM